MSQVPQKVFLFVFRFFMLPAAVVWTLGMAYITSVHVTQEIFYMFQNSRWKELVVGFVLLLTAALCYGLFRYMALRQKLHQRLLQSPPVGEHYSESEVVEL